ncbi:hypothetical protein phi1422_0060 [Bdellovibrio phage phi1422]|uniref:hypothetical protein n=1 Tax=Bdellovibrio phage phi1422 TaxID=1127515 RepID=UPI0002536D70|nr:hypothetical protein F395_gp60 [Bdellovibrio phage phi1422]AFC22580.1 hypothetical protein phi1422_0060 [Bdellovibrio phage phi1422]
MDLSSLSNQMVTAQALNNLILVWPEEDIGIQPEAKLYGDKVSSTEKFLFHYEGENRITLDSDITDNFVEENYAVQDHIALHPELINTQGFIGELNNVTPSALESLKQAAEKLTVINAYMPQLSVAAVQAYNRAAQAYQAVEILKKTKIPSFSALGGGKTKTTTIIDPSASATDFANSVEFGSQTQQQVAYQKFYGYRAARTLFTVQTPWAIYKNCAIKTLEVVQDADTRMMSTFNITFKPIRVAYTRTFTGNQNMDGRAYFQGAVVQESGMSAVNFENMGIDTLLPGA